MSHDRLQAELLEDRNEIKRLKGGASTSTTPIVHKDLSLISVIPKRSGSDDTVTLEEFLESIESSGRIGRWTENDQREVPVLKLTGSAKLFYQFVMNSMNREQPGNYLRKLLGSGTGMSTRTSTTLRN